MDERQAKAKRMLGLVARWRSSETTLSAFARANGVTRDTLVYWVRHSREGGGGQSPPRRTRRRDRVSEVSFTPVQLVAGGPTAAPVLQVTLPDGTRLAFDGSAPQELVLATLTALRARC